MQKHRNKDTMLLKWTEMWFFFHKHLDTEFQASHSLLSLVFSATSGMRTRILTCSANLKGDYFACFFEFQIPQKTPHCDTVCVCVCVYIWEKRQTNNEKKIRREGRKRGKRAVAALEVVVMRKSGRNTNRWVVRQSKAKIITHQQKDRWSQREREDRKREGERKREQERVIQQKAKSPCKAFWDDRNNSAVSII